MDIEKLKPQVVALAKIYRVLSDDNISPQSVNMASMRPLKAYTERMIMMQKLRKITPKTDKIISELIDNVNISDWEGLFEVVLPLELQGVWLTSYTIGVDKTKITTKRKQKGLSQIQLAVKVGATQKDISRWEQGRVKPNTDTLIKLANALDCTIDDLI